MPSKTRRSGRVRVSVYVPAGQYRRLMTLLKAIGEQEAPYLRQALEESAQLMVDEIQSRAPTVVRPTVGSRPVRSVTSGAVVEVRHPAAKPLEFGVRKRHWRRPRRAKMLYGPGMQHPVRRTRWGPFKARPFIGIVDRRHAIGAAEPRIRELLAQAIEREWERAGLGGE